MTAQKLSVLRRLKERAMKTLLVLGYGYSAAALAARLLPQGWTVLGTTRDAAKLDEIRAQGVEPLLWPCELREACQRASHILASAAPNEAGDPFLQAASRAIAGSGASWLGYLSTTAVYGDHNGAWVDEDTPTTPQSQRAILRVLAEMQWLALDRPAHIFRLAGIYGPGRGPFKKVRDGTARRIIKPGQVFSRIHVDDIAQTLQASMARPDAGRIYNLCDNDPAPPEDVIGHAAQLLGLPVPPEVAYDRAEMSPMARSFYGESKKVSNQRMRQELGLELIYPTYREGLAALLAAEES
jgi:nucleoside-diphosphate-sugar epimerase